MPISARAHFYSNFTWEKSGKPLARCSASGKVSHPRLLSMRSRSPDVSLYILPWRMQVARAAPLRMMYR